MTASPFPHAGKLEDQATALKAERTQHADTKAALSSQAAAASRLSEDLRDRYGATRRLQLPCIISASFHMRALSNMQNLQLHVTGVEPAGML